MPTTPVRWRADRFVAAAIDRWRGIADTALSCEVDVERSPNPRPMITPRFMSQASDSNAYRPPRRGLTVSGRRSRAGLMCAHRRGLRSGLASELGHRTPVGFLMGPAVLVRVHSNRESRVRVGCSPSRRPATHSVTSLQTRTPSDSRARRRWSGGGQHRRANGGKRYSQRGRGGGRCARS